MLRESLGSVSANAAALDLGFLYRKNNFPWRFGLSVQNLGPQVHFKDESASLPATIHAGILLQKLPKIGWQFIPKDTLTTLEFSKPIDENYSMHWGLEIPVVPSRLSLRGGYHYRSKNPDLGSYGKLSRGLTLGFGLQGKDWTFDFSAVSQGDLGLNANAAFSVYWE